LNRLFATAEGNPLLRIKEWRGNHLCEASSSIGEKKEVVRDERKTVGCRSKKKRKKRLKRKAKKGGRSTNQKVLCESGREAKEGMTKTNQKHARIGLGVKKKWGKNSHGPKKLPWGPKRRGIRMKQSGGGGGETVFLVNLWETRVGGSRRNFQARSCPGISEGANKQRRRRRPEGKNSREEGYASRKIPNTVSQSIRIGKTSTIGLVLEKKRETVQRTYQESGAIAEVLYGGGRHLKRERDQKKKTEQTVVGTVKNVAHASTRKTYGEELRSERKPFPVAPGARGSYENEIKKKAKQKNQY